MTRQQRVLAVDDSPLNLRILEEILAEEFEIEFASGGHEALQKAMDFKPDVILLDVMMPDLDGLEVCRRIRQATEIKHVHIVLVSAKALPTERAEGMRAGANCYLTKPFDEMELLDAIRCHAVFSQIVSKAIS